MRQEINLFQLIANKISKCKIITHKNGDNDKTDETWECDLSQIVFSYSNRNVSQLCEIVCVYV